MAVFSQDLAGEAGAVEAVALTADFGKGLDVALDFAGNFILGNFQVIARLQIRPKSRAVPEITREAEGRISGDAGVSSREAAPTFSRKT